MRTMRLPCPVVTTASQCLMSVLSAYMEDHAVQDLQADLPAASQVRHKRGLDLEACSIGLRYLDPAHGSKAPHGFRYH